MAAMFGSKSAVVILLLGFVCLSWSETVMEKEQKVLDDILAKYDVRIRPVGINGTEENAPVVVSINMYVRSISKIDDLKMEYTMQITLRQNWIDERFKYEADGFKYVTLTDPSKIWMPDLFFSNEVKGHLHDMMTPNVFVRIHPNGNMQYSSRLSLTLSCPMNMKMFPFDRQVCTLRLASYGWTTDDLMFIWKELDPVQMTQQLNLPRFNLDKVETTYCTSKTSTGEYSCLLLSLSFERDLGYYLRNVFLPSAMLVMVSWFAFWLEHSAITARSLFGVTTLLAMVIQTLVFNSTLAPVSYTRSIDVWTGVCMTFLFVALMVTASANYWARAEARLRNKKSCHVGNGIDEELDLKPLVTEGEASPSSDDTESATKGRKVETNFIRVWLTKIPTLSKRLDIVSRVVFPLGFALFVIVYWCTNLLLC